jgi:hypothetical protein
MLGNEGDFLYHPNLQRDIETSKKDDIGNLFKIPEEELARIRAAQARLVFEEEKEEVEEAAAAAAAVAAADAAAVAPQEEAKPVEAKPPAPKAAAAAPPPAAKRISYPVKISGTEYVVSAVPNQRMEVAKFFVYEKADKAFATAKGESQAEFKGNRWVPKAGTVILYKK